MRLAGRGTEGRQPLGVAAAAARAGDALRLAAEDADRHGAVGRGRAGRRDAVLEQLAAAFGADPVGGPGGCALQRDAGRPEAGLRDGFAARRARSPRWRGSRSRSASARSRAHRRDRSTSRTMPRSRTDSAGTSGSSTVPSTSHACSQRVVATAAVRSPHASGKRALQMLHLGQDVAHVLAVHAALAGAAEGRFVGHGQRRFVEDRRASRRATALCRSAQRGPRPCACAASSTASDSNSSGT